MTIKPHPIVKTHSEFAIIELSGVWANDTKGFRVIHLTSRTEIQVDCTSHEKHKAIARARAALLEQLVKTAEVGELQEKLSDEVRFWNKLGHQ